MPRIQRCPHVCRLLCIALVGLAGLLPAQAIDENLTKGATNNHIFESGVWGENIDLLNGGLNLTIPIGPAYKVAGDLSYQLKVSYSSKLWHIEQEDGDEDGNLRHRARSRLQGMGQAGLGFSLQLGRLMTRAESAECVNKDLTAGGTNRISEIEEKVFEDATGATHTQETRCRTGGGCPDVTRGAVDGSYMKIFDSEVWIPDGTRYILGQDVPDLRVQDTDPDWPRCYELFPINSSGQPDPAMLVGYPKADYDIFTNDYRGKYVTRIEGKDRAGSGAAQNYVSLVYEAHTPLDPNHAGMGHLIKEIVSYRNGVADPNYSISFLNTNEDPTNPSGPRLKMGYVKSITLPVFSNTAGSVTTATYTFSYTVQDIWDAHVNPDDPTDWYRARDNADDKFERVLLLTGIQFPEGYGMSFGYTGQAWGGRNVGYLQSRTLPTGAKIQYEYASYDFTPAVCSPVSSGGDPTPVGGACQAVFGCTQPPGFPERFRTSAGAGASVPVCQPGFSGWTMGISEKRIMPDPTQPNTFYRWTYDRVSHAAGRPNPAAVAVTDPFGNDTLTYFHAENVDSFIFYECGNSSGDYCKSFHNTIWKNGTSYKTEYYRGSWLDPGNLLRTEYQTWVDDVLNPNDPMTLWHSGNYRRMVETGTIFHDDGGKTVRTVNDEWDGYGNFRKSTEYGFDELPYRLQRSDINKVSDPNSDCPGLREAHCNNWILGAKSCSETLDPSGALLQRSEFAVDDYGRVTAQKDLLTLPTTAGSEPAPGDPAIANPGDIKTEYKYEGDPGCPSGAASYPTGSPCYKKVSEFGSATGIFEESYTYPQYTVSGVTYALPYLATRQIMGVPWKAEEKEVDAGTGLTRWSKDPAGVKTTFSYDALGRLTEVKPDVIADPGGVTERPATLSYPDIRTTILEQTLTAPASSATDKIYSKFRFDTLGRLIQVEKRQWNDTATDASTAVQKKALDILGRVTWEGEWGSASIAVGDLNHGTTFDYTMAGGDPNHPVTDPFGRVHKTTTADGKVTRTEYMGATSSVTVEGIQSSGGTSPMLIDATTVYEKDGFNRLTRVLAPRNYISVPGVCAYRPSGADAEYTYDRLDRMTGVRLESLENAADPVCPTSSQYRSFVYDALGRQTSATHPENGTVQNLDYDAAGNLLKRQDAVGNVFFSVYDTAARLTKGYVDPVGADPNNIIIDNTYDQTGPTTFGLGLGKLTTSTSSNDLGQAVAREEFRFTGMNGRLGESGRRHGGWDTAIGSISSQPELLTKYRYNALGLAAKLTYPEKAGLARTVLSPQMSYTNGHLTSIEDVNRGVLVEAIQYNPAGGVSQIKTRGEVVTDIMADARNRPASITVTKTGASPIGHFASGAYAYDGAGNITSIGTDQFRYDALNRLAYALIADTNTAGNVEELTWQYDPLGNMTGQNRVTSPSGAEAASWFRHFVPPPEPDPPDPNIVTDPMNRNQIRSYGVERLGGLPNDPAFNLTYDGNGNLLGDRQYEFIVDARNRIKEVHKRSDGALVARYAYDVTGYRVSKYDAASQMTTYFVRDATGRTLSEFRRPNKPGSPSWLKDYVYAADRHLAMVENEVPGAPSGIAVTVSAPSQTPFISLTWAANPEPDIAGYLIWRTWGEMWEEPPEPLIFEPTSPSYDDADVIEGIAYTYKILAIDAAGRGSEYSDTFRAIPGDTAPPAAPTAVSVVAGDSQVTMTWTGPTTSDLYGYRIYRKPSTASTWQAIGPVLARQQLTFTDTTAVNYNSYDYQVKALDTAGLLSTGVPATPAWRVTPTDTTPPEVPQGVAGFAESAKVDLTWQASTAPDFLKFEVFRSCPPSGPCQPIDPANPGTPLASPQAPLLADVSSLSPSTPYEYRVRSVDLRFNRSALSDALVIQTRELPATLPRPTIDPNTQMGQWSWQYCYGQQSFAVQNITGSRCHLPEQQADECYYFDDPNTSEEVFDWFCPPWTHENSRRLAFSWPPEATGVDLKKFRLYGRRNGTADPYQLRAEYLEPWVEFWNDGDDSTGFEVWDHYPVAVREDLLPDSEYQYEDNAFDPAAACHDMQYRVSAVAEIGGAQRESELSLEEVTLSARTPAPENLQVGYEPVDPEACTDCKRLNPQFYGLTLSWTPGGAACDGVPPSYNVYRSRYGSAGPPLRLTRDPVGVPVMRVDYLPLAGPEAAWLTKGSVPYELLTVFKGPMGNAADDQNDGIGDGGDFCGLQYRVTAVGMTGGESALSNPVLAHTDTQYFTNNEYRACYVFPVGGVNTENLSGLASLTLPDPNSVMLPGPVQSPTWEWRYGPDPVSDVGPIAGNWALVKWGLPAVDATYGPANDFRLLRKKTGEPAFTEVPLKLIPGDDRGIREFVWQMPLELGCDDAEYAIQSFDLYDQAGGVATLPQMVPKHKLIPENPTAFGNVGSIDVSWDGLPGCEGNLVGYTVLRATADPNSCVNSTAPTARNLYTAYSVSGALTSWTDSNLASESQRYWYRVVANWGDSTGANESAMSPPVCMSGLNETSELVLPGTEWPFGEPDRIGGGDAIASLPEYRVSPYRAIGQSGGANPAVSLQFYHLDHLGTPRVITDVNGSVISTHKYLPFGEELSAPPSTNTHEFTGHERDAETGMDYMLARYYSPAGIMRFASVDPADESIDLMNPQTWNRYSYVLNAPVDLVDPDGETSYHCSRPVRAVPGVRHGFIVHHATGPGQGGNVRSNGETTSGRMGEVTPETKGTQSEGTSQTDQAAWQAAGTPGSDTICTELAASDDVIAGLADSLMPTEDYEISPGGSEGLNSNSGSTAIAQEGTGTCDVLPAGGKGMVGATSADRVQFDRDRDGVGDKRQTSCPPPPPKRPLDDK